MKNFMKSVSLAFGIVSFAVLCTACTAGADEQSYPEAGVASPESQGISSEAILAFIDALEEQQPDAIHSLMIRRNNKVVAGGWWTPYRAESPHLLWSLSKSFTSTAIGMAQDEGLLSINDQVISFFPEDCPENPSHNLESMRIRDLLRMNTGHKSEPSWRAAGDGSWPAAFLSYDVPFKPGTRFQYNSMATYMCSAILQKVTGETTLDYLTPRLFEPLGIEKPTWDSDPNGVSAGGWGLSLRTADISKFGQLLLQKGMWEGRQLVSEAWVKEATSLQTCNGSNPDSDWDQGYGYQFWQCRYGNYRGDGAFGQFCVVVPAHDVVIAITSGSSNLQGILDIIWDTLLPAMETEALPENPEALEALEKRLEGLALSTIEGEETQAGAMGNELSGLYAIEENALGIVSLALDLESSPIELTVETAEGEFHLPVGYRNWEDALFPWPGLTSQKVAVQGAWTSANVLELNLQYYESPQSMKWTLQFGEEGLDFSADSRAAFGPRKLVYVKGKRK